MNLRGTRLPVLLLGLAAWTSTLSAQAQPTVLGESRWTRGHQGEVLFQHVVSGTVGHNTVAVADRGAGTILLLDLRTGSVNGTVGRKGQGPGEFVGLTSIHATSNGFVAFDEGLARLTHLDKDGKVESVTTLRVPGGPAVSLVHPVSGERTVGIVYRWDDVSESASRVRIPIDAVLFSETGTFVGRIGAGLGAEITPQTVGSVSSRVFGLPAWGWETVVGGTDSTVFLSPSNRWEIAELDADDGTEVARFGRAIDLSLTGREPEQAFDAYLDASPGPVTAEIRRNVRALGLPTALPAYKQVLEGPGGQVWVGEHSPRGTDPVVWHVFDRNREFLFELPVPPRTKLLHIGENFVLARTLSELEEQAVVLFELNTGSLGGG